MNKEKNNTFQMIVDYEGDVNNLFKIEPPEETPILATRNMVLFPGIISPILVGRANSLNLINYLQQHENVVFAIFCQRDANIDHPISSDLFEYGVYAKLLKVLDMPGPGKNVTVIVQGLGRCQLHELKRTRPYLVGRTSLAVEAFPEPNDAEYAAMCVRHYAAKGYGPGKIRNEFFRRGIPKELWDGALLVMPDQEDQISRLLRKKLRSPSPDRDEIRKASEYLYRRGFHREEIHSAIQRYCDQSEVDPYEL